MPANRMGPRTYAEWNREIGDRDSFTIPSIRDTYVDRMDRDTIALHYRGTRIVTYHRSGLIILRANGWTTATTKRRINSYSPAYVYQQDHVWYVSNHGDPVAFSDGITVDDTGRVIGSYGVPYADIDFSNERRN